MLDFIIRLYKSFLLEKGCDKIKVFLHLGLSKTGTTAIQECLWKHRYKLKKLGIIYPEQFVDISIGFGQHIIPLSLQGRYAIGRERLLKRLESFFKELQLESEGSTVLFSSEEMLFIKPEIMANILLQFNLRVFIIIYLRRQDLWFESLYKEVIKNYRSERKYKVEFFRNFIRESPHLVIADYSNLIDTWQRAFPDGKIIPRIYDRSVFPESNVILDFLSIVGIDTYNEIEYRIEANPSLSHLSTLVMRKINEKYYLNPEEHDRCIQYLFRLDEEEGSPIRTFFTLPERLEFLGRFREANERLFRDWFSCENKFVLSEEEIRFYEEQDRIAELEIEKMVEDRYRKVLTYLMEENVKPLVNFKI